MIRLVEQADKNKAPTQRIVDKWASWLVPLACLIAVATYLILNFAMNMPNEALVRAVTVLVVFCPCALALATPTSIMAAIGHATKNGVLIKSGEALEHMGKVDAVAFDKTGTLTYGKLTVSDIVAINSEKDDILAIATSVESRSEHPIAKAVVAYAKENSIASVQSEEFQMRAGKGVTAEISGIKYFCGNEKLLADFGVNESDKLTEICDKLRGEGKAIIIVGSKDSVLGVIALSDKIKETSAEAIAKLHATGITKIALLTGDNEKAARQIAGGVGIDEIHASLLPEGKVEAIEQIAKTHPNICMVGDGVNDAAALKTATVGIAMGSMGSDIAIDAADIALMGDDISKISYIKKLSNMTVFSIKFNITLSMIINIGAVIMSTLGMLNPATGALVHNAGSVLVVLNAARLYDKKIS